MVGGWVFVVGFFCIFFFSSRSLVGQEGIRFQPHLMVEV